MNNVARCSMFYRQVLAKQLVPGQIIFPWTTEWAQRCFVHQEDNKCLCSVRQNSNLDPKISSARNPNV